MNTLQRILNILEGEEEANTKKLRNTSEAFSCQLEARVEQAAMFHSFLCSKFGCYKFASGMKLRRALGQIII